MIGRQSDPNIFEAHLLLKESKKVSELTIERQSHRCHFGTVRPHTMSEQVVRREADAEKIRSRSITQFLLPDEFLGKIKLIFNGAIGAYHLALGLMGINQFHAVLDGLREGRHRPSRWL